MDCKTEKFILMTLMKQNLFPMQKGRTSCYILHGWKRIRLWKAMVSCQARRLISSTCLTEQIIITYPSSLLLWTIEWVILHLGLHQRVLIGQGINRVLKQGKKHMQLTHSGSHNTPTSCIFVWGPFHFKSISGALVPFWPLFNFLILPEYCQIELHRTFHQSLPHRTLTFPKSQGGTYPCFINGTALTCNNFSKQQLQKHLCDQIGLTKPDVF